MEHLTKEQFLSLARSLPWRWFIDGNNVRRCYVAALEGREEPVALHVTYGRIEPVFGRTYETRDEALEAKRRKEQKEQKELDNALSKVATYFDRNRWRLDTIAGKDSRVERIVSAAADCRGFHDRKEYSDHIEELRFYVRTGTLAIGGTAFRKDEVAFIKYGAPLRDYESCTTPIEVTLRNGDKLVTKNVTESAVIQDVFGGNTTGWQYNNVKWPDEKNIKK